ncbi:hypothetical protein [Cryptosporangium arvum]|uniref:Integral membrane protein n=1 Tax=Cryptosporangium arvum DSM 44712 TaxID=927661 RepID=A0A010ZWG4_9ACTN|nr:hypothetical protein [Cryptosporangium arvum]EXG81562.1 hypothetical protein CryarDRAFT_2678 [Cryptosporangium arvum DSM 44712]
MTVSLRRRPLPSERSRDDAGGPGRSGPGAIGAVAGAALLVAGVAGWGAWLTARGVDLHLSGGQPLTGRLDVRLGPALLLPVVVGVGLIAAGPVAAARWRWPVLLAWTWAAGAGWAVSLALVDGVGALGAPLATRWEYLHDVDRVAAVPEFLGTFTDHVLGGSPGFQWVTHVSGHPPGALLVFAGLDRLGLSGPGWAAALCVAAGASAAPAVLVTVRSLAGADVARRVAPFVVLAPTALWIATSADALFCGVTSWGIAALASSAAGRGRAADVRAAAGGLALGAALFLSYGLVLIGVLAVVVVAVRRRVRPLLVGGAVVVAVVASFAALGFWWWDGFLTAADRVREGSAWIDRPTGYFVAVNLAAVAVCVGPAAVGGLTVLARGGLARASALPLTAGALVLAATASGLAKGEVERIFLPFAVWLLVAAGALPAPERRRWLAAQAVVALAVQLGWMLKW